MESSPAQTIHVSPGDAVLIPVGWRFQFKAADDAELRFLCYTSPPWPGADEAVAVESGGLD
jgi:mannose-6-phosphate isomerase-like protein (cupin superfamily)